MYIIKGCDLAGLNKAIDNFLSLKDQVTDVTIQNCDFSGASKADIEQAFSRLTGNVSKLVLISNIFGNSCNELELFGNKVPDGPTSIFSSLSRTVRELRLINNNFNLITTAEFNTLVSTLPDTICKLTLSCDEIRNTSGEALKKIFAAMSEKLLFLRLPSNNLGRKNSQEFSEALKELPKLSELDLTDNELWLYTNDELKTIFSALPATGELYLKGNSLTRSVHNGSLNPQILAMIRKVSGNSMADFFGLAPENILNSSERKNVQEMKALFSSLPSCLRCASIYDDYPDYFDTHELHDILSALPDTVRYVGEHALSRTLQIFQNANAYKELEDGKLISACIEELNKHFGIGRSLGDGFFHQILSNALYDPTEKNIRQLENISSKISCHPKWVKLGSLLLAISAILAAALVTTAALAAAPAVIATVGVASLAAGVAGGLTLFKATEARRKAHKTFSELSSTLICDSETEDQSDIAPMLKYS